MKKHEAEPSDEPPTGVCDSCGRVVYMRDGVALDHPVGAYPKAPNCPGSMQAVPSVKVGDGPEALEGYHLMDGTPATLEQVIRESPAWAANRIREMQAREEGRAEAATVPCGMCAGMDLGPEDYPCPAPGCVNGRVDARLAAALWAASVVKDYGGDTVAYITRCRALAKYGPEAEETT